MKNVSLERYYFVLYDGALILKMSEMAHYNPICDETLHKIINNDLKSMSCNNIRFPSVVVFIVSAFSRCVKSFHNTSKFFLSF